VSKRLWLVVDHVTIWYVVELICYQRWQYHTESIFQDTNSVTSLFNISLERPP